MDDDIHRMMSYMNFNWQKNDSIYIYAFYVKKKMEVNALYMNSS